MANRQPFGVGEWYHCYSRGVDKRRTFQSTADYRRFLQLMYVANSVEPVRLSNLPKSYEKVFALDRQKSLVSIAGYALMPNHFHFLIQEVNEGGITKFMQKLGTAYSMYFNIKNERVGNLFVKPFRSKHITSDRYLKRVIQYVHLNPADLYDKNWKSGKVKNMSQLEGKLKMYPYSSLQDYQGDLRPEHVILSESARSVFEEDMPDFALMLREAAKYNEEISDKK